jgi:hypothetical protein
MVPIPKISYQPILQTYSLVVDARTLVFRTEV